MQMYNPEAKKLVNVSTGQVGTLKKAGWLNHDDPKAIKALAEGEESGDTIEDLLAKDPADLSPQEKLAVEKHKLENE